MKKSVVQDGRMRSLDPAAGRMRASRILAVKPDSTLAELAEGAGISIATAKDVRDRVRSGRDPLPPRLRTAENRRRQANSELGPGKAAESASTLYGDALLSRNAMNDVETVVDALRKDPALRTDVGRALLFLLKLHAVEDSDKWRHLAAGVPEHRAEAVARAARRCAERWTRFARDVEDGRRQAS
ncbi:hypothetical protein [Streptomyces sp. NPDC052496]|uniref:hypothetical protein n=1 Tax=Streptomyces sp. NPDC052496 TaxID=3154951 RepID=UPI0034360F31